MKMHITTALSATLLLATALPASAELFTEGVIDNGSSSDAVGQSFSPGLEPTPDLGLPAGEPVFLDSVTFFSGGSGTGDAETYLAILPGAFYDFNGDPNGTFTPTVADTLGISDNTFDTTALSYGEALAFTFTDLTLNLGDVVSAVFVTINDSDEITPIAASTAYIRYEDVGGGVFEPVANYGGSGNYDAGALFADADGDGYLQGTSDGLATDLSFVASFSTIPEPGTLGIAAIGLLGLARRRR